MRYTTIFVAAIFSLPALAPAQWTSGQAAVRVIGQPNFTTSTATDSDTGLRFPQGVALDTVNGKLYVADRVNSRVLRYAWPVVSDAPAAELVFGQPDFNTTSTNTGGRSASTMSLPSRVATDPAGRLWVSDSSNSRILRFDGAATATLNGVAANGVLGQADFTSVVVAVNDSTISNPQGLTVDTSGTLWSADFSFNRIVRWNNAASLTNGAPMDGVLGQATFTGFASGTTSSTMNGPVGIAVADGRLWVAERNNSRVLRFNDAASKANGADADGLLGQTDSISSTPAANAGMNQALGVTLDRAGRLYVAEDGNNRIYILNGAAAFTGLRTPTNVLGQISSFGILPGLSSTQLNDPYDVAVDSTLNRVVVVDRQNSRVLVYQASAPLPVAVSAFSAE
jgi:sugar lactone lactonase YvrE